MYELEQLWKKIPGSVPHMGKNFGYHQCGHINQTQSNTSESNTSKSNTSKANTSKANTIKSNSKMTKMTKMTNSSSCVPFNPEDFRSERLTSDDNRVLFEKLRRQMDPSSIFLVSAASYFLGNFTKNDADIKDIVNNDVNKDVGGKKNDPEGGTQLIMV